MQAAGIYADAERWLKQMMGADAEFRDGQWEAVQVLVEDRGRVLVVQKTGWGKSLVYFLATRLLRDRGEGMTVLISPLLALMRNQIDAANRLGLIAATINSTNRDERAQIEAALLNDEIDILLISPERLADERFRQNVWSHLRQKVGLLVVDEAHCISDWGHDFRPDYRRILHILDEIPADTPILGTTATANDRVVQDVNEILGGDIRIQRGSLTRRSLNLFVCQKMSKDERLTALVRLLKRLDGKGSGIIYCATTDDCLLVSDWLNLQGFNTKPYYSGVDSARGEDRVELEQALLRNEVHALVASTALGMGFDKPDLSFIIHFQHPGSIISYYQQIGRAGRGIDQAQIILMHGDEDVDIQRYFMDSAFPAIDQVEEVIEAFEIARKPLKAFEMLRMVNVRDRALEKILQHLEIERIIRKEGVFYHLIEAGSRPNYLRWEAILIQRQNELAQMEAYMNHGGCLMQFLAQALDDHTQPPSCGHCQNCRQHPIRLIFAPVDLEPANIYLRKGRKITFKPRKRWLPGGVPGTEWYGRIEPCNMEGLALCRYSEAGWADEVRKGKYEENAFSQGLVEASAEMLRDYWKGLSSPPQWVTAVPSLRHPTLLVPDFAAALANALDLPYYPVIKVVRQHQQQKLMENKEQQVKNLLRVFDIQGSIPDTPVLLVDDMVDSGWTFTVLGQILREHGCGVVFPFALARVTWVNQ